MTVNAFDVLSQFGDLQTMEVSSTDPTATQHSAAKGPVGALYRFNGNVYRYVLCDFSDVASLANAVLYWESLSPSTGVFKVTSDISDAIASGVNMVAGVQGSTVLSDKVYSFIQVGGVCTALTAASTAAGDLCKYGTDSTFGRDAAGSITNQAFGIALDTRNITAGTNTVLLQNLMW